MSQPFEACRALERALEEAPNDRHAAEQLVHIYVEAGDWSRTAEAIGVVLRCDADRGAELLLELEERARGFVALDAFTEMTHEALALRPPTSSLTHRLRRAQTRALVADRRRPAVAAESFHALVDAFESDEDARAYEAFLETAAGPDPDGRRRALRAVRAFRASQGALSPETLLAWARSEAAGSEPEEAIVAYRFLLDAPGADRAATSFALFALLSRLERIDDALDLLTDLLAVDPPLARARELARELLHDPAWASPTAIRLEAVANGTEGEAAARLFELLVDAFEHTSASEHARRHAYRRLVALRGTAVDLSIVLRGAIAFPDETLLWTTAERIGRLRGELDAVVRAYAQALAIDPTDASLAETLGRRAFALEKDPAVDPVLVATALERVLAYVPAARWALDRVKAAVSARGAFGTLLALYDRAIAATPFSGDRAELLGEAAVAARDLAGDADQAIRYFALLHDLVPEDAHAVTALERLYERGGKTDQLVALLEERAEKSPAATRRELERRVVVLWLDARRIAEASTALHASLDGGAAIGALLDIVERVAAFPHQRLALDRLAAHYESGGEMDERVRVAEASLRAAETPRDRRTTMRDVVRCRLLRAHGAPSVFVRVAAEVAADIGGHPALAPTAHRAFLARAVLASKTAPTDADFEDAAEGASLAVRALAALAIAKCDTQRAARLFERGARLPLDRPRQRAFLADAAREAERTGDVARAIRLLTELAYENADDAIAETAFARLEALLRASGADERVAELLEARAARCIGRTDDARGGDLVAAGGIWERFGRTDRALDAYARGAALASATAHECVARIHVAAGRWLDAIATLEWLVGHAGPLEKSRHIVALANAHDALGAGMLARTCLEEAIAAADDVDGTFGMRARLADLYRRDGAWRPLVALLAAEVARVEGRAAAARLREMADVVGTHLGDATEATRLLERAIAADPTDTIARAKLAQRHEARGEWERVVDVLGEHVAHADRRTTESGGLRHRRARALLHCGRGADALAELRAAAKLHPTHAGILADLGRLALEAGDLDEAERALRAALLGLRRGGSDAVDARIAVYLDLATIARRKDDDARAANFLESALDVALESGADPTAIDAALRALGRHDLAMRAAEWRIAHAGTLPARATALADLAQAWHDHFGRSEEFVDRIRAHADAIEDAALGGEAVAIVFDVHLLLGQPDRATALVDRVTSKLASSTERARVRVTIARRLLGRMHGRDAVIAELTRALDEDPTATEAADVLADALERDGRIAEHARVLARRLAALPRDAAEHVDLGVRLGHALERAERPKDAAAAFESVFDRLGDRKVDRSLVRLLAERLEVLGSDRLADALEVWIGAEPACAPTLMPRLVALREREWDDAGLLRAATLGFGAEPTNATFRGHLVRIHRERGDLSAVAQVLVRALAAEGSSRSVLLDLVETQREMGVEAASLPWLDAAIARESGDAELRVLRARAREDSGDEPGAIADLLTVRADRGVLERALAVVERLVARAAPPAIAAHLVRIEILRSAGRGAEAGRAIDGLVAQAPPEDVYAHVPRIFGETKTRVAWALALADGCERLGRAGDALDLLDRGLIDEPGNADLAGRLERICEAIGDWDRLTTLLVARAESMADGAEKAALFLNAGRVLTERLGRRDEGLQLVQRARAVHADNVEAALLAIDALVDGGSPREAIAIADELIERSRRRRMPLLARVYLAAAKAHIALDELVEAFDAAKAGFAIDVRLAELALLLGGLAIDLGDEPTAERALMSITAFMPRSGLSDDRQDSDRRRAWSLLASLAAARGDVVKATRFTAMARGEDPVRTSTRVPRVVSDRPLAAAGGQRR